MEVIPDESVRVKLLLAVSPSRRLAVSRPKGAQSVRNRHWPRWLQVHGTGAFQCVPTGRALLRRRSSTADGGHLRTGRVWREGGGRDAWLGGVRDGLSRAGGTTRY